MTSKEKIEAIKKCILNWDKEDIKGIEDILNDLERLEKQDKILERLKRPLFYSERKKLGEEYIKWAKENNVNQNDLTSIITWCFCFKMKEWLDNGDNL